MANYPIRVYPKPYNGSNPKKLERQRQLWEDAKLVEEYLNRQMETVYAGRPGMFPYCTIACALRLETSTVRELLQHIGYGSNGITIGRYEEPVEGFGRRKRSA
jgi:hypothetical protein